MKNNIKIQMDANKNNITFARGAIASFLVNLPLTINFINEIKTGKRFKGIYDARNSEFNTIYLGGGTPSVLRGEEIYNIITALKENYKISAEQT